MNQLADIMPDIDVWALPDDLEALGSAGEALAQANDRNRWKLGDLAMRVTTKWGEHEFIQFAGRIKVFAKTLYDYRAVSAFYPSFSARAEFPNLSWSHYRMCARLGHVEAAMRMLERASAEDWSATQLTDAINAVKGKPPVRRILLTQTPTCEDGALVVVDDGKLVEGRRYEVTVREAGDV